MSTFAFRAREKKRVTLSITPLIDVLFLLIIFFTLTSTFKRVGELELELPKSSTSQPVADPDESERLELVLFESGDVLLGEETILREELPARLRALQSERPNERVLIKAEAGVDHGEVVELLDLVRDAGFPGLGIGTHTQPVSQLEESR